MCPNCNQPVNPGAGFCGNCGTQLAQPTSPAPMPAPAAPQPAPAPAAPVAPVFGAQTPVGPGPQPAPTPMAQPAAMPMPPANPAVGAVPPAPQPGAPQMAVTNAKDLKEVKRVSLFGKIVGGLMLVITPIAYFVTPEPEAGQPAEEPLTGAALIFALAIDIALIGTLLFASIKLGQESSTRQAKKHLLWIAIIAGLYIVFTLLSGGIPPILQIALLASAVMARNKLKQYADT